MATVTTWAETVTDIGPMYPFVGTEMLMVVGIFAFWVVWHIVQTRAETREYEDDMKRLSQADTARKALDREG